MMLAVRAPILGQLDVIAVYVIDGCELLVVRAMDRHMLTNLLRLIHP
jgi:hypothetical protein